MDKEIILKLFEEIEKLKQENIPVIVEGSNDKKALEELRAKQYNNLKRKAALQAG